MSLVRGTLMLSLGLAQVTHILAAAANVQGWGYGDIVMYTAPFRLGWQVRVARHLSASMTRVTVTLPCSRKGPSGEACSEILLECMRQRW